ncbi:Stc1 domain-containing protein [Xylariomycetidae sp. FL2044]|nr:Stc1 domain-containing protein [Xylariomycetidae sp. FL2044]
MHSYRSFTRNSSAYQTRSGNRPEKFRCRVCGKWKAPAEFSNNQLAKWDKARKNPSDKAAAAEIGLTCKADTAGAIREIRCHGPCGKSRHVAAFSKNQRNREEAWCIECTDWKDSLEGNEVPTLPPGIYTTPGAPEGGAAAVLAAFSESTNIGHYEESGLKALSDTESSDSESDESEYGLEKAKEVDYNQHSTAEVDGFLAGEDTDDDEGVSAGFSMKRMGKALPRIRNQPDSSVGTPRAQSSTPAADRAFQMAMAGRPGRTKPKTKAGETLVSSNHSSMPLSNSYVPPHKRAISSHATDTGSREGVVDFPSPTPTVIMAKTNRNYDAANPQDPSILQASGALGGSTAPKSATTQNAVNPPGLQASKRPTPKLTVDKNGRWVAMVSEFLAFMLHPNRAVNRNSG